MIRKVIAQMPMSDPMGGGLGLPGMPPGGPGMAPQGIPERPKIHTPLKSVGEILYDFNSEEYIALHPTEDEDKIAKHIWMAYGGNSNGGVDKSKVGKRKEDIQNKNPEELQKEIEDTENKKWERLLEGKNLLDITSLDEIISLISSLTYGTIKKFKNAPAPPGGGGMPLMANTDTYMKKLSMELKKDLDNLRKYF